MTGEPLIDYEALTQTAMRSVVKTVLASVATTGLPGDHHFYISFDTQADGVAISKRLKEKYPQEMTIVLQHRFWDLNVHDERFEVKLTFDGIAERLVVPYQAIKVFFDPSVRYGLQFDEPEFTSDAIEKSMSPQEISHLIQSTSDTSDTVSIRRRPKSRGSKTNGSDSSHANTGLNRTSLDDKAIDDANIDGKTKRTKPQASPDEPILADKKSSNDDGLESEEDKSAEIVSLDAFRKK